LGFIVPIGSFKSISTLESAAVDDSAEGTAIAAVVAAPIAFKNSLRFIAIK
jgi:hypothetical protein